VLKRSWSSYFPVPKFPRRKRHDAPIPISVPERSWSSYVLIPKFPRRKRHDAPIPVSVPEKSWSSYSPFPSPQEEKGDPSWLCTGSQSPEVKKGKGSSSVSRPSPKRAPLKPEKERKDLLEMFSDF
jgi:hypothetical protein